MDAELSDLAKPASVLFDARTVGPGMSGVGRYSLNLLSALSALPGAPPMRALFVRDTIDYARRDPALSRVELVECPVSHEAHPAGDLWLRREMPRLLRPGELYHGPAFIIPGGRQPFPRVVTVHDLFVFTHRRFFSLKFRAWMRWAIGRACRFADMIVVPTETVRQQLIARGLAPAFKICAIAEAPDAAGPVWDTQSRASGEALAQLASGGDQPRLLTVGSVDPRKDLATARSAFVQLKQMAREVADGDSVKWIWVGGPGTIPDDTPEPLKVRAAALGFMNVGHAPGEAIRPAYRSALAYVTCSRTEGFGIPLVEAMAAGCPIVASDIPVHREVGGEAALYFPPGDAAALAGLLARILGDEPLRRTLARRSLERSALFSWTQAARQTLEAYCQAHRARMKC